MYDVPTKRIGLVNCSRSLMDKMLVCGTSAPGSIPGESTKIKSPSGAFNFALAEQSGGLFVRNRSPIEIIYEERNKLSNRGTETVSFETTSLTEFQNLRQNTIKAKF